MDELGSLIDWEKFSVINFKLTDCEISELDRQLSNKNQRYLSDSGQSVKIGNFPKDLSKRGPGSFS